MLSQKPETISWISTSCVINIVARILRFFKEGILFLYLVDTLVPENERLVRKQLCASARYQRKFGETVDSCLLLTKTVRIRYKTLIVSMRDLLSRKTCFFSKD